MTILCLASYEKGHEFLRQCKRRGAAVLLVLSQLEDSRILCLVFQNLERAFGIFISDLKAQSAREQEVSPLATTIITGNHAIDAKRLQSTFRNVGFEFIRKGLDGDQFRLLGF